MIKQALDIIRDSRLISIICHRNPDADAIGSMIALEYIIKRISKSKVELICKDEMSLNLKNIFGVNRFILRSISNSDTIIFTDCSSLDVSGISKEELAGRNILSIDHHKTHNGFGIINIVNPESSSTCEMVYEMYKKLEIEIPSDIAWCLAAGILFDTGGLKHSNTSADTLRVISELKRTGADLETLNRMLFKRCSSNDLKMFGLIFKRAKINENGVLSSIIDKSEVQDIECCELEMKKAIDYLNQVEGKKLALLGLSEDDRNFKISMRSQDDKYDVSKIARLFDGGGHIRAAGFRVENC